MAHLSELNDYDLTLFRNRLTCNRCQTSWKADPRRKWNEQPYILPSGWQFCPSGCNRPKRKGAKPEPHKKATKYELEDLLVEYEHQVYEARRDGKPAGEVTFLESMANNVRLMLGLPPIPEPKEAEAEPEKPKPEPARWPDLGSVLALWGVRPKTTTKYY